MNNKKTETFTIDTYEIKTLKKDADFPKILHKIIVNPLLLNEKEKIYILTCAILLIKKYSKDKRYKAYLEFAYYIILKYSLSFKDYQPLYDFSINLGFYPIAQVLNNLSLITNENISNSLISCQIDRGFKRGRITETLDQQKTRERILKSKQHEISYIAPTSFGKSQIIVDHIVMNLERLDKFAIIVPTKSLLMQTYRMIRKQQLKIKILLHDDMYNGEERFIAIFTQERALRLLDKCDLSYDILYIDEAHNLFENDSRSRLLSRLIKLNHIRDNNSEVIYLSPLVQNSNNLKIRAEQNIFEQRIPFNVKEPEYYELRLDGSVFKYNKYFDQFYLINKGYKIFQYIDLNKTDKTFFYLNTPHKIQIFAKDLADHLNAYYRDEEITEIIENLEKYVHPEFDIIESLNHGIVYLHAKMPDNVKDYLKEKYVTVSSLKYIIANKVILEGINLPIDSLFILSGRGLQNRELVNLIGRVNRLDQIFNNEHNDLIKLIPQIHFINNEFYNGKKSKLEKKIRLLKNSVVPDKVDNPLLLNFDPKKLNNNDELKLIISQEEVFYSIDQTPVQMLKRKMLALGMASVYKINDELIQIILDRIDIISNLFEQHEIHFLERLQFIFIQGLDNDIIDKAFLRLKSNKAINYYKRFYKFRNQPIKNCINMEIEYYHRRIEEGDSKMYIGYDFGETAFDDRIEGSKVYIDLSRKNNHELVNIAIIKKKIEDDFVNYTLYMFLQCMVDYGVLSLKEYQEIVYGTNDSFKLQLTMFGIPIHLINHLELDGQLDNIYFDNEQNLKINTDLERYITNQDDFYRFELRKYF